MYSYLFTAAAEKDLEEAFLWYEDQSEGLGEQLLNDVELACQTIAHAPARLREDEKGRRRFLLKALPSRFHAYSLIYKIEETRKRVIITAVMHSSRNPNIWTDR